MKQETKKEQERTAVFPVSLPGCHYATGPPLLEEICIVNLTDYKMCCYCNEHQ